MHLTALSLSLGLGWDWVRTGFGQGFLVLSESLLLFHLPTGQHYAKRSTQFGCRPAALNMNVARNSARKVANFCCLFVCSLVNVFGPIKSGPINLAWPFKHKPRPCTSCNGFLIMHVAMKASLLWHLAKGLPAQATGSLPWPGLDLLLMGP